MKSKLVINTRSLQGGHMTGVQRYISQLAAAYVGEVDIIQPPRPLDGLRGHVWEQFNLPRELKGRLLWSPSNTGPLAVARQVVTVHDMSTLDHPEWFNRKFGLWYRQLLPLLVRRVSKVITVSEYSRHRIVAHTGVQHAKVAVIPLAADDRFKPATEEQRETIRAKFNLPERYVLCVGSLEPRKNLGRLFTAWGAWSSRPADVHLVVVGGQGKAFRGLGFDALPDGVQLLGRVDDDDLPALYGAAQAFIYPSLYEGFGLPPLEAMACGVPVITSNVTSLPEVVGDAALMIDPLSVESIVKGLERLLQNPGLQDELRGRGLLRARQFSWGRTAEKTWAVLEAAADE